MREKFKETRELTERAGVVEPDESVQRNIRWPASIDEWIVQQARAGGFRSPQEFVLHLVRQAKSSRETQAA